MINQDEITIPQGNTMTNKKPRRRRTKPLTPLQQAELADPMPKDKLMANMRRQMDRKNAQFGIKSRAGKSFDLATGVELTREEVNRRVEEYEERRTKIRWQCLTDALRGERVNVPPELQDEVHELIRLFSNPY